MWKDREDSLAETAFLALVNLQVVDDILPDYIFNEENDYYIPVVLSFFGDERIDAMLALMIRQEKPTNDSPTQYENFILQALLSLNEPIKRQREMFLYHWRQRLRSRVSDLFDEKLKSIENASGYEKEKENAKEAAVKDGAEALQRMILVLLAEKSLVYESTGIFEDNLFKLEALKAGSCSPDQFNCFIKDKKIKESHADRCAFICEFCKQAKISIIEGLGAGKLKGALAREASAALVDIAKQDPVKARVLIRGEAGGGKGVAAEDFHAHCMKKIAEETYKIKAVGTFFDGIKMSGNGTLIADKTFYDTLSAMYNAIKENEFYKPIREVLTDMGELPSFLNVSKDGYFKKFKEHLDGTGWWTWYFDLEKETKKPYARILRQYIEALKSDPLTTQLNTRKEAAEYSVQAFMGLIVLKIYFEFQRGDKADWSFNFFQVNCGIMGGQNSELAESIRRLFGQTDDGKASKALPGLFQICSYVGGTLFLDEIADAPIRIQDNLLRPLEEGKVSRPGWETINENVKNIRIVAATFKDLFKLATQYEETLPSGNPKGFRRDLLTRLTRNPPVTITPVWHHFVHDGRHTPQTLRSQFCYVMMEAFAKEPLQVTFWDDVYDRITKKLDAYCAIATGHLPDEIDRRRHFASKVTMRFLKALAERAATADKSKLDPSTAGHLDRMLDYLLCDS